MKKRPTKEDLIGWEEFTKGQGDYFMSEKEILNPKEETPNCGPKATEYIIYDPQALKVENLTEDQSPFVYLVLTTEEQLDKRKQEVLKKIQPYVNMLPELESAMLELYYKGYTQYQIAEMYDIRQPTVWAKIQKAQERLKYLTTLPILPYKAIDIISKVLRKSSLDIETEEVIKDIAITRIFSHSYISSCEKYQLKTAEANKLYSLLLSLVEKASKKGRNQEDTKKTLELLKLSLVSKVLRVNARADFVKLSPGLYKKIERVRKDPLTFGLGKRKQSYRFQDLTWTSTYTWTSTRSESPLKPRKYKNKSQAKPKTTEESGD